MPTWSLLISCGLFDSIPELARKAVQREKTQFQWETYQTKRRIATIWHTLLFLLFYTHLFCEFPSQFPKIRKIPNKSTTQKSSSLPFFMYFPTFPYQNSIKIDSVLFMRLHLFIILYHTLLILLCFTFSPSDWKAIRGPRSAGPPAPRPNQWCTCNSAL